MPPTTSFLPRRYKNKRAHANVGVTSPACSSLPTPAGIIHPSRACPVLCVKMISAPPLLMQASSSGPKPAAVYRHRRCTVIRCAVAVAVAPAASSGDMHEVLGLRAGATRREIRAAYRRLARERHPDAAGSADDDGDFIRLHDAYAALYDSAVVAHAFARPPATRPRRTWETNQCW